MENMFYSTDTFSKCKVGKDAIEIPELVMDLFKDISTEYFVNWYKILINEIHNEIVVTIYGDGIKK